MAMRCDICGKGKVIGRRVSHSGVRTRRVFKPNLHTAWVVKNGRRVRMRLCTKCLRKVKKEKFTPNRTRSGLGPAPEKSPAPKSA